jgi:hypothetical protein
MKFSIDALILLGGIYGIHEIFIVGTQRYFSKIVGMPSIILATGAFVSCITSLRQSWSIIAFFSG